MAHHKNPIILALLLAVLLVLNLAPVPSLARALAPSTSIDHTRTTGAAWAEPGYQYAHGQNLYSPESALYLQKPTRTPRPTSTPVPIPPPQDPGKMNTMIFFGVVAVIVVIVGVWINREKTV